MKSPYKSTPQDDSSGVANELDFHDGQQLESLLTKKHNLQYLIELLKGEAEVTMRVCASSGIGGSQVFTDTFSILEFRKILVQEVSAVKSRISDLCGLEVS